MSFWGHEAMATIDAETAETEIAQGAQVIDVGEPNEWLGGHIPGALLVEPELVDNAAKELAKDRPVIVAGRNADVAAGCAAYLHDHGFQVAILAGGAAAWHSSGRALAHPKGD